MAFVKRRIKLLTVLVAVVLLFSGLAFSFFSFTSHQAHASSGSGFYERTNLVSDIPGVARFTDSNLVNPWGLSHSPTSPWWVSDNGTGVSTLYISGGRGFPQGSPLVVNIPPPTGSPAGTTAAPTGNVFNPVNSTDPDDFVVSENGKSGPSIFIFATEDGTISGWNPTVDLTHAILAVDNSKVGLGAVYKGLAFGSNASGDFIYATNFRFATVDVFNENFAPAHLSGNFTDPNIPNGYAPFNIQNIGGKLYVTYAKQDAAKHDDVSGAGHGFIDVYDTNGNLLQRLISHGVLNSPWGLALAPANFGQFSNDLLVGNFGNGLIHAFNPNTGALLGKLLDKFDNDVRIDDLWALAFGNGHLAGETDQLFFTAGIADEGHGLFGSIDSENS